MRIRYLRRRFFESLSIAKNAEMQTKSCIFHMKSEKNIEFDLNNNILNDGLSKIYLSLTSESYTLFGQSYCSLYIETINNALIMYGLSN